MARFPRRVAATAALVACSTAAFAFTTAGAADPASEAAANLAVQYLDSTQAANGGWDGAAPTCATLFTTADVALALAEANQSGAAWSTNEGRLGVAAVVSGSSNDAFDALDAAVGNGAGCSAGKVAQLVILATATNDGTSGFSPSGWDPAGNGSPVNLVALLVAGVDGSFGSIFSTWIGVIAQIHLGNTPASVATSITYIRGQQNLDGGWGSFGSDVDTTGATLMAMIAGGVSAQDPDVLEGLAFLRGQFRPDGGFVNFTNTDESANSTAFGALGLAALGFDSTTSCWLHPGVAPAPGEQYVSPDAYTRGLQATTGPSTGNIQSPADFSGDFSTSQAVAGLLRSWLPPTEATAQVCPAAATAAAQLTSADLTFAG